MKTRTIIYCAVAPLILSLFGGCATKRLINRNAEAGHKLALLFKLNDNTSSDPCYPNALADLLSRLKEQGIDTPLPRCECADGKLRDFVYIPGLQGSDGRDWPFLFSPPEMDREKVIVVYLDATAKVMDRERANYEADRTRTLVRGRKSAKNEKGQ